MWTSNLRSPEVEEEFLDVAHILIYLQVLCLAMSLWGYATGEICHHVALWQVSQGRSQVRNTYKTDSPLFWHSTSGYKQGCERKLLRGRCVCVFFVCIGEPQMPMFIVLGQTRLKAVLRTSDFFNGMGNLADMEFLVPQRGPR